MSEENGRERSSGIVLKKKHIAALAAAALLLIAGGVVLGLNWGEWFGGKPEAATQQEPFDIDPAAQAWQSSLPEDAGGAQEGIKIPGYPSIALPAGEREVSVSLVNPEGNPCYFTFELALKDTDEVLYTSRLVPPGQAVYEITLSRALEAGEYDAVLRISTTSLTDGSEMNGANVETRLIVI